MKNKLIQLSILCATSLSTGVACAEGEFLNRQIKSVYDAQTDLALAASSITESIKQLADYYQDTGVCAESPVETYGDHPMFASRRFGKSATGQCCVRFVLDTSANGVHAHLAGKGLSYCYPSGSGSPTRSPKEYYATTNIDYNGTNPLLLFEGDLGKTSGISRIVDMGGNSALTATISGVSNESLGFTEALSMSPLVSAVG